MLRVVGAEAADVFIPEKEAPEVRFLQMDRQCPRHAHQQAHQHGQRAITQQFAQAALPEHVRHGNQHRQHQGQETLGQETQGAGQAHDGPGPKTAAQCAAVERKPQGYQAQIDPQGELRIQVGITRLPGHQAEAQVEQRAGEAFARVFPQATGDQIGEQHAQSGGKGRGDAHTKQVLAEHRLAQGDQPVAAGRLFEIADAHEMRRYPVAALEHFLADLGVAGFVRGPQAVQAQGKQVKGDKGQ